MATVMLYKSGLHAKEIDQRYLDDVDQRHHVEKFMAAGYQKNPDLVFMYNPETREQLPILKENQPILEARGFFATPTWVYHPTEGRKIVSKVEADRLLQDGWYDTPAKFPGNYLGVSKNQGKLIMPKGNAA